jgi:hypothetical protein
MDVEQLQNIEMGLHEQVEDTQATNELIAKLFSMMSIVYCTGMGIPAGFARVQPRVRVWVQEFDPPNTRTRGCTHD